MANWNVRVVVSLGVILVPCVLLAGHMVDIIALHSNDEQGMPGPYYTIGDTVTVTEIVTVGTGTFAEEFTEVYVQDRTAGIKIYADAVCANLSLGDSLTVRGTLEQYRGMTELVPIE